MSMPPVPPKVTLAYLRARKRRGDRLTMLTVYDYPGATLADRAGIDIVFVGDSVGTNLLGYRSAQEVTMGDMLHHARAARRGVERGLFLVDMPFLSYQIGVAEALRNAGRLVQEAGAEAVKIEGGDAVLPQVEALSAAGVPVMGHLGFTPQAQTSSYYVYSERRGTVPRFQGKDAAGARALLDQARRLADAGAFALVLEMVAEEAAQAIAESLEIPVIGIGSGRYCDGQVLTSVDLLGWSEHELRVARAYAEFRRGALAAMQAYRQDVLAGRFPAETNVQHMDPEELAHFRAALPAGRSEPRASATADPA